MSQKIGKKKVKKKKIQMPWYVIVGLPLVFCVGLFTLVLTQGQFKRLDASELIRNQKHYKVVSFEQLLSSSVSNGKANIPEQVESLNGQDIAIQGFMTPLENDGKNLKKFMLVDQLVTCMFCQGISVTQWVMTTIGNPKGARINDDQYEKPVIVYGKLEVRPEYNNGSLESIYRMKTDGIEF